MAISKVINAEVLLDKIDDISNIDLTQALTKAAYMVENSAKRKCPVGTGVLRNSITHNVYDNVAEIGTNVEYAPYVEIGTGIFSSTGDGRKTRWSYQTADGQWHSTIGMKPQPYLEPAWLENKESIEELIKSEVSKELEKIARR